MSRHDPSTYVPHAVHSPAFGYPETNCWTDVVVELLHSRGLEPLAALGCTVALAHEGDQFAFFKPRPDELEALYGVDVHELQPYRTVEEHWRVVAEQGRTLIVEVDAWWLPDTAGTSYRTSHVKTAIGIEDLTDDVLTYFHNAGLHALHGEDRHAVFRSQLPGYVEVVGFGEPLLGAELRETARELLRDNALRAGNPFEGFRAQLVRELDDVLALPADQVHLFAFATTRMAGAAAALAAAHVRWVLDDEAAAAAFERVSATTRVLTMRLMRRKPFDPDELLTALTRDWSDAQERLGAVLL